MGEITENNDTKCFPKLRKFFNKLSCKLRCSNCVIIKQENEMTIEIDDLEHLKDMDIDLPFLKQNNISVKFI